jgi:hypothetical protein
MKLITADYTDLMRQAHYTAELYLCEAIKSIDGCFGEGYSKKYPQLVEAYMRSSILDFVTAVLCKTLSDTANTIAETMYCCKGDSSN